MILLNILVAISIAFLLKELNGPFDIILKFRTLLFHNKYVGKFFFDMFTCYYCLTFHTSWISSLILLNNFDIKLTLMLAFSSSILSILAFKL